MTKVPKKRNGPPDQGPAANTVLTSNHHEADELHGTAALDAGSIVVTAEAIPALFTLSEMVAWLVARDVPLNSEELRTARSRLGRNDGPSLLYDLAISNCLVHDDVLTEHVGDVWSAAEYPQDCLEQWAWFEFFERAGYTVDGKRADRPNAPMRLYRGSCEANRERMAWTADPIMAEKFASGSLRGREQGVVWTAVVEPWRLLCALLDSTAGRGEGEYVIDPDGLDIRRWSA